MKKWPLWLVGGVAMAAITGICLWQQDKIFSDRAALGPDILIDVRTTAPGIAVDARYFGTRNFTGGRVDGYRANKVLVTAPAAVALAKVQKDLNRHGLGLLLLDGYRPTRAVAHFVRWAKEPEDTALRARYHPDYPKEVLFELGYIATKSGHSRGSTVDVTLIDLETRTPLDMGTPFDFFGPASAPMSEEVNQDQQARRLLLREAMMRHGFIPLENEWWHFTLADEPFPDTYFDFPVE